VQYVVETEGPRGGPLHPPATAGSAEVCSAQPG
jgi:hypothetical protein